MKQLIQSNSTLVTDHFVKFEKRQDGEINTLKQQLKAKDSELSKLREELERARNRETDLKAENKILRQEVSILKIEMDQQCYLIKNQKDIEIKYHALETKLQSIINKLKVFDVHNENHTGISIERSDSTAANKSAQNVHVAHQDLLVDDTEFIDRDSSVADENDCDNRGVDNEPEIDEPEYNQPLYSDVARSKKVSKSQHETKGSFANKHENSDSVGKRSQDTQRRNAIFKGVTRRRIQRIVLYNVDASESIESVTHELTEYAAEYGVKVTSTRLLKEYKSKNWSSYMISVNLDGRDFHKIEHNSEFWPDGITWRKWIPRSQRDRRYDADDAYGHDEYGDGADYNKSENDDWGHSNNRNWNDQSWE